MASTKTNSVAAKFVYLHPKWQTEEPCRVMQEKFEDWKVRHPRFGCVWVPVHELRTEPWEN